MAGSQLFGGGSLASAELYDPVAGAFTPTGGMTTSRSLHTATLLNDGRVLVAGGETFSRALRLGELYNPSVLVPAPKLFGVAIGGTAQGAIWHASSGELASPDSPAVAGEILSMYTTSLSDGGLIPPQVAIGGQLAGILYFGAAPGYPGYNQVNFRVPSGVTPGAGCPCTVDLCHPNVQCSHHRSAVNSWGKIHNSFGKIHEVRFCSSVAANQT